VWPAAAVGIVPAVFFALKRAKAAKLLRGKAAIKRDQAAVDPPAPPENGETASRWKRQVR